MFFIQEVFKLKSKPTRGFIHWLNFCIKVENFRLKKLKKRFLKNQIFSMRFFENE